MKLGKARYQSLRGWVLRNARDVELSLWRYLFESGSEADVERALAPYQNPDGGFGHALEADNWNPGSSPITTMHAYKILLEVNAPADSPLYAGMLRYFESAAPEIEQGWPFCIESNDAYPRAPWWSYSAEENAKEYFGVTCKCCDLALRYAAPDSRFLQRAKSLVPKLIDVVKNGDVGGDMGLEGAITLWPTLGRPVDELRAQVNAHIDRNPANWSGYTTPPSRYIFSPQSTFYPSNEGVVQAELDMLVDTLPEGDVWPIPWRWYGMDQYAAQFAVAENWWKSVKAIENAGFLRAFGHIED